MPITAVHTLIYSDDAPATRAFLRDVLRFGYVADASSTGKDDPVGSEHDWLIFTTGPSELGVHPTVSEWGGETYTSPRHHSITLMCDNLTATIDELTARGAEFEGPPKDEGFGVAVLVKVPGADSIMLYEPRHATAYDK